MAEQVKIVQMIKKCLTERGMKGSILLLILIELFPNYAYNTNTRQMEGSHGLYGYLSGFTAAALLQPLENIKMVLMLPPKDVQLSSNFLKNLPKSISYLYKDGGLKAFYRGIVPNVVKTGFSSSIYFSVLRLCENLHQQYNYAQSSLFSSFSSSMVARIASALASNPLSIVETRFQYAGSERWSGGVFHSLARIYRTEGLTGFFNGGLASCYKEGMFAGLFYALYTEGKALGINSFIAGMVAGMISTSITHPFEIIRAQLQSYVITEHSVSKLSIAQQVRILFRSGQAFRGLAPRIIKKPLTNTFAFLMFEMMENKKQK